MRKRKTSIPRICNRNRRLCSNSGISVSDAFSQPFEPKEERLAHPLSLLFQVLHHLMVLLSTDFAARVPLAEDLFQREGRVLRLNWLVGIASHAVFRR